LGHNPSNDDEHVGSISISEEFNHSGHQGQVRAREQGETQGVGIFLDNRLDDLFGRLVEAGVDHFKAFVTKGTGNDLGSSVVPV
jgi:hypothetical protein